MNALARLRANAGKDLRPPTVLAVGAACFLADATTFATDFLPTLPETEPFTAALVTGGSSREVSILAYGAEPSSAVIVQAPTPGRAIITVVVLARGSGSTRIVPRLPGGGARNPNSPSAAGIWATRGSRGAP